MWSHVFGFMMRCITERDGGPFQRLLGASLDPKVQYFGRSLASSKDLNDDTIPDISVGAYGKVVQLW